jgi:hypothetical protein
MTRRSVASLMIPLLVLVVAGAIPRRSLPPPVVVTLVDKGAGAPTLAADAAGVVYVAWSAGSDTARDVFLGRVTGGKVEGAVRVNNLPGDFGGSGQTPPQVLAGTNGTVYVVWHKQQKRVPKSPFWPGTNLRIARSADGGKTFSPAVTINDDAAGPPTNHSYFDAALGPDGSIYVSWLDRRETDRALRKLIADSTAGRTSGPVDHEKVPGTQLRVARSSDGGRTWTPGTIIDRNTCVCCRTAIAVGPEGNVYVAWRAIWGDNIRDVSIARSSDGGKTFSAPVKVHDDGWHLMGCPDAGPGLAVDGSGRVHAVWYTGAEGHAGAYYASSSDQGRSFTPARRLIERDFSPTTQVKVTGGADRAWVTFEDVMAEPMTVQVAETQPSGALLARGDWTRAGRWPEVVATPRGPAVAWLDDEAVRVSVPAISSR